MDAPTSLQPDSMNLYQCTKVGTSKLVTFCNSSGLAILVGKAGSASGRLVRIVACAFQGVSSVRTPQVHKLGQNSIWSPLGQLGIDSYICVSERVASVGAPACDFVSVAYASAHVARITSRTYVPGSHTGHVCRTETCTATQ